mmetsp:Transcript_11877/g.32069  ORF Transcript_11877/g.32069 Transcript_11877/m.32069 type:complete len:266 (-) Transcript_11877:569-1366(-)
MPQKPLDSVLLQAVHIGKGAVEKCRLTPRRTPAVQDEQADADREHVGWGRRVAPVLCNAGLPWHHILGKPNFAELAAHGFQHRDGPRHGVVRRDDFDLWLRRHVALWCAVGLLAHSAKVPERRARGRVTVNSHPKVHELELTIFKENVLERDVPVTDAVPMEVCHCQEQLAHVALELRLRCGARSRHVEKVPAVSIFGDEPRVQLIGEDSQHRQDVRRQIRLLGEVGQDPDFGQRVLGMWRVVPAAKVQAALARFGKTALDPVVS